MKAVIRPFILTAALVISAVLAIAAAFTAPWPPGLFALGPAVGRLAPEPVTGRLTLGPAPGLTAIRPHGGSSLPVEVHPAAVSALQQEHVLSYWTPARIARARPMAAGGLSSRSPLASHGARVSADRQAARAAVSPDTAAAGWPGGGKVARTTGKVFFTMGRQLYVCSASAVASANMDVVITAAHCVKNGAGSWASHWTFVPGFSGGGAPYGTWTARHYFVASQWSRNANDNDDVAFVTVNPQKRGGKTVHLGQVVGGQAIAFGARPQRAYVFGYPAEPPYNGGGLYYCSGRTKRDAYHATADAGVRCQMTAGASGGPWLSGFDPVTGTGTITSVNSFKYTADHSTVYGPHLGSVARALFWRAASS